MITFALCHAFVSSDIVREQKRNVERTIRQMDRERMQMANTEKKLIADIKKAAAANQIVSVDSMVVVERYVLQAPGFTTYFPVLMVTLFT